jgi:hypothetical protein
MNVVCGCQHPRVENYFTGSFVDIYESNSTSIKAENCSYLMDTGVVTSGVKRLGRETNDSPPCIAEPKNAWSYTSTHPYVCMAWCSIKLQGLYF